MKSFLTLILLAIVSNFILAQVPDAFSYQAVIRDDVGGLVQDKIVSIKISILQNSIDGEAVYTERHAAITNTNGLISIQIGRGSNPDGAFSEINWTSGSYFIETAIDLSGGTNFKTIGTSELLSVPYALHAKTAERVIGGVSFTHYIGEEFGGGVIFHLWKDSDGEEHGLIVDLVNLSGDEVWSNIDQTLIGLEAQSSWDGLSNSNAIVSQEGHTNSAAALCLNSTNGGQNDWYLPSIDELSLLWHSRFNVNKSLSSIEEASPLLLAARYWSSTEYLGNAAWLLTFTTGTTLNPVKTYKNWVRAIRAF
jgi:hypothetical protein